MSEWGPWVEHDGRGCPCVGQWVRAIYDSGVVREGIAGSESDHSWRWVEPFARLIRYRIRKPRALEQLREIARNPEREMEDA